MAVKIIKKLTGGLDKNSNLTDIAPKNYLDAVDITDKSPRGESDGAKQLNNNTDYAFGAEAIEVRNKKYRYVITKSQTSLNCSFTFILSNGSMPWGNVGTILVIYNDSLASTQANIQEAFDAIPTLGAYIDNIVYSGNEFGSDTYGTITADIEFQYADLANVDYVINPQIITDANGDLSVVANVLQDCITVDKVGVPQVIKYSNLGNELFVFLTTGLYEPLFFEVQVQYDSLSDTYQIITGGENLQDGDEVFLSGTGTEGGISAYFVVNDRGAIQNYFNPVTNTPYFDNVTVYTFNAVKYKRTYSSIIRAVKNEVSGLWSTLTLVESIKLNFRIYKQIRDAIITPTDLGTNFDWTDKLNPLRRMLYLGEWMANGFLTVYNPQGLFDLDTIDEESRLQLRQNTSKVTLTPIKYGGTKREATYVAFVRYGRKSDGVLTTWSHVSNTAWVHSNDLNTHVYGATTLMALNILIEQIPLNEFDTAQIGIVEFNDTTYKAYILPDVNVNGLTSINVIDTGDDSQYVLWGTEDVEQVLQCFENAGNLMDFDNYVIASDVELSLPYDLTEFAQTLELGVSTRNIEAKNDYATYANSLWLENTYNNVEYMTNYWTSFMPSEWVRVALVIDWENGAPTSYFWAGDVKIDPALKNWQPTDNGTDTINIYQYFVTATNIDTNYILPDGKYLKDVVKDIRFGIAPIKKEVLATGIAVSTIADSAMSALPYKINSQYGESFGTSYPYPKYDTWMFYSPDFINNGATVQLQAGDVVTSYGLAQQNIYYVDGSPYCIATDYNANTAISVSENIAVTNLQTISSGQNGNIIDLRTENPYASANLSTSLGGVSFQTASDLQDKNIVGLYYIRPLNGGDSPYSTDLKNQKYYIVPQDQWYDKQTHNASTSYSIYGGDCFPQKSYYRTIKDTTHAVADKFSLLSGFYSYNRTNGGLRSGSFPNPNIDEFLQGGSTYLDYYTYDSCFTPRHIFQNGTNYNADALFIDKTIATIYYSGKRLNNALFGNNRIWKFADNGVLENRYGRITDMSILLGTSGNNAILVKQERAVTLQYFNNTGRLVSTTIDVLLGTGDVLGTKGSFLSVGGTAHKFSRAVCLSPQSGKEFDIWFDAFNQTINRFGADGSRVISDNISSFLIQNTTLFKPSEYNNLDTPAKDWGVIGAWDNQKKEYVVTFRGVAKYTTYDSGTTYGLGDVVTDGNTFGFDELPVLFKSKIANNDAAYNDDNAWLRCDSYIDACHQCFTLVWNELDNVWKGFYSFLPNVYGSISNNYVSTQGVGTYEHNGENKAVYYCSVPELATDGGDISVTYYGIGTFNIDNTWYQSEDYIIGNDSGISIVGFWNLTYPFTASTDSHIGYFFYDHKVQRYYRITSFLSDSVFTIDKDEDVYVEGELYTIPLYYSTCNSAQPYIKCVVNEGYPRYFNWGSIELNLEKNPYRVEYEAGLDSLGQKTTQSYNDRDEFEYFQGVAHCQIKNDTTNGNDNNQGVQGVEGYWCKEKIFFTPNIKNRLISHNTIIVEQNKKQK